MSTATDQLRNSPDAEVQISLNAKPGAKSDPEQVKLWQERINAMLAGWNISEADFADEEMTPPSSKALQNALLLSLAYISSHPAPLFLTPDGEGGVSFTWRDAEKSTLIDCEADGRIVERVVAEGKMTSKREIQL